LSKGRSHPAQTWAVLLIYFLSGASALAYEVLWQRLLKLILGNTTYATGITTAVFLGGLAGGAFLVRKRADRVAHKLLVYGVIELLVAVFAAQVPLLLQGIDFAYVFLFRHFAPSPISILLLQALGSAIVLGLPAVCLGTTLPILASLRTREPSTVGREAAVLYAANTLGALTGAAESGFFLIRLFGVLPCYYGAVGLSAGVGVAALVMSRFASPEVGSSPTRPARLAPVAEPRLRRVIYYWLFLTGFVALGYEMLWVRTIVHLLNADVYSFTAVLVIYLFGYAAGIFAGGRLAGKSTSRSAAAFGMVTQWVGLCGVLYFPLITHVIDIDLLWQVPLVQRLTAALPYFLHLYVCTLLFFLPSFGMGAGFPLLVDLERAYCPRAPGETVSQAFGLNTLGCVLGALGTAFGLLPVLGSQGSMLLLGTLALVSGFGAVLLVRKLAARVMLAAILAIGVAVAVWQPRGAFGAWVNRSEAEHTVRRQVELVDVTEGATTTASVHYYPGTGAKVIATAGINVAGDAIDLRQTQKVQGHLPVILHGGATSVLTVGFGSGELTKTLTLHDIPDITCVEISPEMVALAKKHFSHINLGSDLERRVTMRYMDAKNYLHVTDRKFDVIENDSIWPGTFADSSSLYTREYFLDAKRLLGADGVFSTWLPLQLPPSTFLSIVKTFTSVFENTLLVYPHFIPNKHLLLIGQKSAHPYDFSAAAREFGKVRESLALIGARDVFDLLEYVVADQAALAEVARHARVNSDYHPFVEFDLNRWHILGDPAVSRNNLAAMVRATRRPDFGRLLSFAGVSEGDRRTVLDRLARDQGADSFLLESHLALTPDERLRILEEGLRAYPDNADLRRMKEGFFPQAGPR